MHDFKQAVHDFKQAVQEFKQAVGDFVNPQGNSGFAEKDGGLRIHVFTIASGDWDAPMRRERMDYPALSSSGGNLSHFM